MKNKKIPLESGFWSEKGINCPFALLDASFDFAPLVTYKEMLNDMMMFMHTKEIYRPDYPGQVFVFYKAFRSFIRAAYRLQNPSKWQDPSRGLNLPIVVAEPAETRWLSLSKPRMKVDTEPVQVVAPVETTPHNNASSSRSCFGTLSPEEFAHPFQVFQTAFKKQTLEQYEFFLCEAVHLSLSPYIDDAGKDLMTPYIYLTKMLDAAQLIIMRRIKKRDIKRGDCPSTGSGTASG